MSSVSPLVGSSGSSGGSRAAASCPVLLIADGRDVTAVDAGTGDEAIVLRVQGIICSMVVGEGGESVRKWGACLCGDISIPYESWDQCISSPC